MARFVGRTRPGRTIDFKSWDGIPGIELGLAGAQTALGGSLAFNIPATILRLRGELLFVLDGAAESASIFVTVALGVISSDAFAAGSGSVPDPAAEAEYPWMYWSTVALINQSSDTAATAGEQNQVGQAYRLQFDSKAMRKVKPGQSLAWIVETGSATPIDIIISQTRALIGT